MYKYQVLIDGVCIYDGTDDRYAHTVFKNQVRIGMDANKYRYSVEIRRILIEPVEWETVGKYWL